ncbi:hypothetical protein HUW86_09825 [Fusobacterium sp. SB021]|uniref:hypothetical protein n=1 Tax=Fusobacterium sp. SB021 TaxID=2744227 RepID=UPI003CF19678
MGVDLSKKTLILNGYTIKNPRSINITPAGEATKLSEKALSGKRRVIKTADPNLTITVTVETGTQDEFVLLTAAETGVLASGYFKDSSVSEYSRGIVLGEVGVNKGDLSNDNDTDQREFTLNCAGCKEVLA